MILMKRQTSWPLALTSSGETVCLARAILGCFFPKSWNDWALNTLSTMVLLMGIVVLLMGTVPLGHLVLF